MNSTKLYRYLSSLLISFALYTFLLLTPIPHSFTAFFWAYSPYLFFIIFALYALSFMQERRVLGLVAGAWHYDGPLCPGTLVYVELWLFRQ